MAVMQLYLYVLFSAVDTIYVVCFSLIMLSVDLTSPHIKNKMSKREFIRNTRRAVAGINDEFAGHLYDNVYLVGHVAPKPRAWRLPHGWLNYCNTSCRCNFLILVDPICLWSLVFARLSSKLIFVPECLAFQDAVDTMHEPMGLYHLPRNCEKCQNRLGFLRLKWFQFMPFYGYIYKKNSRWHLNFLMPSVCYRCLVGPGQIKGWVHPHLDVPENVCCYRFAMIGPCKIVQFVACRQW